MGLHHKLCHVLGGSFGLPHAETHAVVLPHAVAYNAPAAPAAMAAAARALADAGLGDGAAGPPVTGVPRALHALLGDVARVAGAPTSLRELGLIEADLDRAAALAAERPYPNPRLVDREGVRALLARAFDGSLPDA
jgi:maleylacetate reductase